jgi:glycosyltransferase involved in cell wall biosynthesis
MVSYYFFPLFSGAANQALLLSRNLQRRKISVFVFTARQKNLPSQETIQGVRVYRLTFAGSGRIKELIFSFSLSKYLFKKRKEYDIVHFHGIENYTFIPILVARIMRKKILIKTTLMGSDDSTSIKKKGRLRKIRFMIFRLGDAFISTSSAIAQSYEEASLPQTKMWQIPNGTDINLFCPIKGNTEKIKLRKQFNLPNSQKVVTFVGAVEARKGIDLLVKAWVEVVSRYPQSFLLIIGPKPGETPTLKTGKLFLNEIKSLIDNYGLGDRISLIGETKEIEKYLRASDAFVFPSRNEGFPTALLEAMACGLPCIISNMQGISSDIVSNGKDGIIVKNRNIQDFSNAILNVLNNPKFAKELGSNAARKVVNKFSIEIISKKYINLYRKLLEK